ncbi:thioredoxin family protein [Neobacillus sp. YIM B02564]|jgi:thioredoxin-like negative regulator of GroEL|uniref:Thioredoxin family protein n=1 Tax=Neobacillus paridis TaxID=2803862 RepID=A0ABS1TU88_9BACI|nr:thioredoxin family protein [Neobacillus paridis]MBL4954882.1 thioredoxin family protein [Neobacillus paridis]
MNEWNRNDLSIFLNQRGTGLVYFYTPLCGTCQLAGKMLGVVEHLVEIEMGKMNLNYYSDLAEKLVIESVPCLLLIRNGEIVDTIYAFHSVPFLLEKINKELIQADA